MFVLASASPRRREILNTLGLRFMVHPSDIDESVEPGEEPRLFAARVAREKALHVASVLSKGTVVLGADTVVVADGEILGKPASDADAAATLRRLSGRWHQVITSVSVARAGVGPLEEMDLTTQVHFVELREDRIARYVATGEGRDKAGAYAIQGIGAGLVDRIEGSYTNVVGLPAAETVALLERHGALREWP